MAILESGSDMFYVGKHEKKASDGNADKLMIIEVSKIEDEWMDATCR